MKVYPLPSLREYILVAQDRQAVTIFRGKNTWQPEVLRSGEQFSADRLGCTLPLAEVHHGVEL